MLHANVILMVSELFNIVSNLNPSIGASLLKTTCKLKHKSITGKMGNHNENDVLYEHYIKQNVNKN